MASFTTQWRWAAAIALIGAALSITPIYADHEGGGAIKGRLANASQGGSSVADVEITLVTYFGHAERQRSTTRTNQEGSFEFNGLDSRPDYSYEITASYQGADYSAPRVSFAEPGETKQVDLEVYEATTQEEIVKATAKYYFLQPADSSLEVEEALVLENGSDRTYIGSRQVETDRRETGRFQPPEGAEKVSYGEGFMDCCVLQQGSGFVDTMAIKPGETRKVYSYRIPSRGTSLSFATTLQQDVERVVLLVPESEVQVKVAGLNDDGVQHLRGEDYRAFSGERLPAGTELQIDLHNLPSRGIEVNWPIVALGVLALLPPAAYLLRKWRLSPTLAVPGRFRGSKPRKWGSPENNPLESEERELMAAIAVLDDRYEAGQLSQEEYEQMRAQMKVKLLEVMRQLQAHHRTR